MEKISIQEYIAYNNRPMAQKMLVKYGLKPAKSPLEMERKLIALTRDYKEDALREFANIHPDKELILKYADRGEKKSKFCGCSGFDGDDSSFCGCSGFDGVTPAPVKTTTTLETTPTNTTNGTTPAPANGVFLKNENLGVILIAGLLAVTIVALSKK
jgi:hypothetical protein